VRPKVDRSGGVVATATAGAAAGNALDGAPGAFAGAIFLDGVEGVLAARRVEAAVSAHEAAKGGAVGEDEQGEEAGH